MRARDKVPNLNLYQLAHMKIGPTKVVIASNWQVGGSV